MLHDFLKRVADPAIVDAVITGGNRFYDAEAEPFFLPLEFTVAGFRFGHTMVRDSYDFNLNFDPADLGLLWNIADTLNGLMSIPNLIAVALLSPVAVKLTNEYFKKPEN